VELLKQPQNSPMPVEEQVVSVYVGTKGHLDDVPVADVHRFENELLEAFRTRYRDLLDHIRSAKDLPPGDALERAIAEFKETFQPSGGEHVADPTKTSAEGVDEPVSDKTLKTE
jgi:F-type H+-transporting ATPase subunit alpha